MVPLAALQIRIYFSLLSLLRSDTVNVSGEPHKVPGIFLGTLGAIFVSRVYVVSMMRITFR